MRPFFIRCSVGLALAGFEPALRLVDHIDAALTAYDAAIAVTLLERAEGVANLHGSFPSLSRRGDCALGYVVVRKDLEIMVDDTGIEPVTPSMSTKCSTAELIIHVRQWLTQRPIRNRTRGEPRQVCGL